MSIWGKENVSAIYFLAVSLFFFPLCHQGHSVDITDPVIYWSLDGNGRDMAGRHNIYRLISPSFSQQGIRGSACLFFSEKKKSQILLAPDNQGTLENMHFLHQSFIERTISLWFKANNPSSEVEQCIIDTGGHTSGMAIYLKDNFLHAGFKAYSRRATIRTPVPVAEWCHVVISFKAGEARLFLNGVEKGAKKLPDKITSYFFNNACALGAVADASVFNLSSRSAKDRNEVAGFYFDGWIDEVKIFEVALNNRNVESLFQNKELAFQLKPIAVPMRKPPPHLKQVVTNTTQKFKKVIKKDSQREVTEKTVDVLSQKQSQAAKEEKMEMLIVGGAGVLFLGLLAICFAGFIFIKHE